MRRRLLAVAAILFVIFSSLFSVVKCQNDKIGVSKGDIFTYERSILYYTNGTDFTNGTFSEQLKIDDISGSLFHITLNRESGSQIMPYTLNITDGYYSDDIGYVLFIPANLSAGDSFHYLDSDYFKINETIFRTYQGKARMTNHFSLVRSEGEHLDYYFDSETGVLLEYNYLSSQFTILPSGDKVPPYRKGESILIKNSSPWAASESPESFLETPLGLAIIIGGILAVVVALVLIDMRKRRTSQSKKKKRG